MSEDESLALADSVVPYYVALNGSGHMVTRFNTRNYATASSAAGGPRPPVYEAPPVYAEPNELQRSQFEDDGRRPPPSRLPSGAAGMWTYPGPMSGDDFGGGYPFPYPPWAYPMMQPPFRQEPKPVEAPRDNVIVVHAPAQQDNSREERAARCRCIVFLLIVCFILCGVFAALDILVVAYVFSALFWLFCCIGLCNSCG